MRRGVWAGAIVLGLGLMADARPAAAQKIEACVRASEQGQSARVEGRLSTAAKQFAACASSSCPQIVASDCIRWQAEVKAAMPSIVLIVRTSEGVDLENFTATLDEKSLDHQPGRAIDIDPGAHRLVIESPARHTASVAFTAHEGDQRRGIQVVLEPEGASATSSASADPRSAADDSAERKRIRSSSISPPPPPMTSWVLFGVGAVSYIAATALYLVASSELDDLRHQPCAPGCPSDSADGAKLKGVISDVFISVGTAALIGGVVVWFVSGSGKPPPKTAAAAFTW